MAIRDKIWPWSALRRLEDERDEARFHATWRAVAMAHACFRHPETGRLGKTGVIPQKLIDQCHRRADPV